MAAVAVALRNKRQQQKLPFDPSELPNGKNAWGGKNGETKRASDAQKRWMNKNKVGDSGGGSLEKRPDGKYRQTGVVNIVLYVGLGLISLGLIITFVGMGEHGFKSPELRLIGPSLIGCGFLFCLLRLFFCSTPACCAICCGKTKPLDEKSLLSPSRETLAEESGESQQQAQRQQQEQEAQDSESDVPQRLETHEENDHQEALRITSKSARRVQSTIPNLIEDEFDDDAELGLHVEYMDEVSRTLSAKQQGGGSVSSSRAASAQSQSSVASKVPCLPDIHTAGQKDPEIVLNPATLEGGVD
ncbi:uncharacterized protein LOC126985602 isoform X2 [Eriocheir sinensis]|uniref:uncharacterized protein LOC126985602 isoform X2 n=1 Tax=Eriocheir sinensis TaxID=95602 RepID=UPI0021CA6F33|nr:uncharacterized protein LOC126985602 isoform X2 [Eriocheir sinensis]XP_050696846.1 uncharacterized protein LOC126985602 isoform X2 [Eriocheir sinensis]XP_050696939.1 uncharacterized protein LOC126985602 isoform X2 [Eriocheir sinensis]